MPRFAYNDIIWGDRGNATLMSELTSVTKTTARLILDLLVHASTPDALKRRGWEPLMLRRMEHHAIFI